MHSRTYINYNPLCPYHVSIWKKNNLLKLFISFSAKQFTYTSLLILCDIWSIPNLHVISLIHGDSCLTSINLGYLYKDHNSFCSLYSLYIWPGVMPYIINKVLRGHRNYIEAKCRHWCGYAIWPPGTIVVELGYMETLAELILLC